MNTKSIPPTNPSIINVSRRTFLKSISLSGAAFVISTSLSGTSIASNTVKTIFGAEQQNELNVFVSIHTNGQVSIVCHRCEMGQGIRTSVPQIIADEMQADWDRVTVVQGKADAAYGAQGTTASYSIRGQFTKLRELGATARYMLEKAGAIHWNIDISQVEAKAHFIVNKIDGSRLGFGDIAKQASVIMVPENTELKLKEISEFTYIGKEIKLNDLDDIVAGKAVYAQDIQLDDMLIASIQRPPVVGGRVVNFDSSDALKVPGVVRVLQLKPRRLPTDILPLSGLAVLATNTWAANEGKKKLKIEWDHGAHGSHNSAEYLQALKAAVYKPGKVERTKGDVYSRNYLPEKTVEATYTIPYQHHQSMETPAATAWVKGDGDNITCTIWAGVQNPQWAQNLIADELGIDRANIDNIDVNVTLMGGAFGRKSKADFVIEAVELSKIMQVPVKVVWSREDDIQHGFYHSISANFMKAEILENNKVGNWIQRVAYPPIAWIFNENRDRPNVNDLSLGFGDTPFSFTNLSFETQAATGHIRVGWFRAVATLTNGFALCCFMDELAAKGNVSTQSMWQQLLDDNKQVDPREEGFAYKNYSTSLEQFPIDNARMRKCLDLLCEKAQTNTETASNEGWGIAVFRSFGSYVAAATKVRVQEGRLKVLEMHTAIDCGIAVTPDRVIAQMEGAMVFGLTVALMGNITVEKGRVKQSNFHDSMVARITQVPPMYVHIIESNKAPGGVGEPGVPPVIPSITNAIFHASGMRIRDLPVNNHLDI